MPDNIEEVVESTEAEIIVDFDDSESRMNFLKTQLNDLLDGINNVYGQDLMEELLKRLEKTVEDYNIEVSGLIGKLKEGKIFEEDEPTAEPASPKAKDDDQPEDENDPGKTFEEQEAEDSDIIARMRARKSHDD